MEKLLRVHIVPPRVNLPHYATAPVTSAENITLLQLLSNRLEMTESVRLGFGPSVSASLISAYPS
jgi:hypothetical protein